jgi:hypothetical protein
VLYIHMVMKKNWFKMDELEKFETYDENGEKQI